MLTVDDFFRDGGLLSQVKPNFSAREGQAELAQLILDGCETGQTTIAEAATGFGKSFAVLVPAVIRAIHFNERVVISTETLALQDQYVNSDIPTVLKAAQIAGHDFTFAAAKGRSNYVCRAKCDEDKEQVIHLQRWARKLIVGSDKGDKADIPFAHLEKDWREIGADDDCERKGCPYYGDGRLTQQFAETDCFVYQAAKDFLQANIVVTNHTLMLLDADHEMGSVLGLYQRLIVDEAHSIPEQAQNAWGCEIRPHTISMMLATISKMLDRAKVDYFQDGFIHGVRDMERNIFTPFAPIIEKYQPVNLNGVPKEIIDRSRAATEVAIDFLQTVNRELTPLAASASSDRAKTAIESAKERLSTLMTNLKRVYGDAVDPDFRENWLSFLNVETRQGQNREKFGILNLKPINVAPLIKALILDKVPSCTFMSATLKLGSSFGFVKKSMGLSDEKTVEFVGKSPFDFKKQAAGYFPTHLPESETRTYLEDLGTEIIELIKYSKGRALILFTNSKHMQEVYNDVARAVPYRCMLQGQMSKAMIVEEFKQDISSCLFATRSFFTGVDIPGEALSCVMLTRAPFRVPSDPMFKAQCDLIDEKGGSSFNELSMPLMLFDVKQAFGRLIRTVDDTGLFAFLDSRANKKSYGQRIKNTLPEMRIATTLQGVVAGSDETTQRAGRSSMVEIGDL